MLLGPGGPAEERPHSALGSEEKAAQGRCPGLREEQVEGRGSGGQGAPGNKSSVCERVWGGSFQ